MVPHTGGDIFVPNTGFISNAINNLSPATYVTLIMIALITLILGVIVFVLRTKFNYRITRTIPHISFITGATLILVAIGCAIPASLKTAQAIENAVNHVETINLEIPKGEDSAVAIHDTSLVLGQNYDDGYIIFAYTEQDNTLRHIDIPETMFVPTRPVSSTEQLTMNSYGIKNEQQNYGTISQDSTHPTKILDNEHSTTQGTAVPITYAAKADSTMPQGSYRSNTAAIHFEITPDIYYLNYEGYSAEEHITPQKHNATFTLDAKPTKIGYSFVEYNTKPDGSGKAYQPGEKFTVDYVNTTIYTIWHENTYKLTYDANKGSGGPGMVSKDTDPVFIVPDIKPTRTGYTFLGWADSATATTQKYNIGDEIILDPPTTPDFASNKTVYAVWEANKYNATFNTTDGAFPGGGKTEKVEETYDANYKLPTTNPEREHYDFGGWWTSQTGGSQITASTTVAITQDTTFYAHWDPDKYNINYNYQGGGTGGSSPSTGAYDMDVYISNPTKYGYVFVGWDITGLDSSEHCYGNKAGEYEHCSHDTSYTGITATHFKNLNINKGSTVYFKANWRANTYMYTFDPNGGSGEATSILQTFDTTVILPSVTPSRAEDKYAFDGWHTRRTEYDPPQRRDEFKPGDPVDIAGNMTLYAWWRSYEYHLVYDMKGGSDGPSTQIQYREPEFTISKTIPKKSGFNFLGWSTNEEATSVDYRPNDPIVLPEPRPESPLPYWSSKKLFAVWEAEQPLTFMPMQHTMIKELKSVEFITMRENEVVTKKLRGAHLICLALWSVLTLMATAALTNSVAIPAQTDTASAQVVTE